MANNFLVALTEMWMYFAVKSDIIHLMYLFEVHYKES